MKKYLILILCLLLLTGCGGSGEAARSSSRYLTSMDTVMTLTAYGPRREQALDQAEAEILRLNDLLSVGAEESEVSRLNQTGSADLSQDTAYLLGRALDL